MNNKSQSTLIVEYCLGLLDEDIKVGFESNMRQDPDLLVQVEAMKYRLQPFLHPTQPGKAPDSLKAKTWALIDNVIREKKMDITDLPLLNKYSDAAAWSSLVTQILPEDLDKSRPYMKVLTNTDKVMQILIATSFDFPEEEHDDLLESFIILSGECECRVGEEMISVKAGGYLEIPLYTSHDVKIVSDGIVGVLQRVHLGTGSGSKTCIQH